MTAMSATPPTESAWPFEEVGVSTRFDGDVLDEIREHCREATLEIGGVLSGNYPDQQTVDVQAAMAPPTDQRSEPTTFHRGVAGIDDWLAERREEHDWHYVGEWHYHPRAAPTPSELDRRAMLEIATDDGYGIDHPIMLILGGPDEAGVFSSSLSIVTDDLDLETIYDR